jgi:hypothetical protein
MKAQANPKRALLGLGAAALALAAVHYYFVQCAIPAAMPSDQAHGLLGPGGFGLLLFWLVGHCDGMDGPVVTLARKALETGNVNLVLPWVQAKDEGQIRHAFEHTVAVRKTRT